MKLSQQIKRSLALIPALLLALICGWFSVGLVETANASIAFERGVSGWLNTGGTTRTIQFTVTGTNTLLVVGWGHDVSSVTSVTYNGVPMTSIADQSVAGDVSLLRAGMYYLLNPTVGTNDLVITRNTSINTMDYSVALYTGVKQSGQPDAVTSGAVSGTSNQSISITNTAAGCWIIGSMLSDKYISAVGPNVYWRGQPPDPSSALFDSNAAVPAGSNNMSWALVSPGNSAWVFASFLPASQAQLEFLNQPKNLISIAGSNVTFNVTAAGQPPIFYQWRFNVTNVLSGQTNSTLVLPNVSLAQTGAYSVLISNSFSSVLSSNATLTVLTPGADADGDGLLSEQEIQYGTNPFLADTDGDGLSDYDELFLHSTNPLLADTDGDGLPDGWEVQRGLNARFNDAADDLDGDGLSNLAEYNWSLANTNQVIDPRKKYSLSTNKSDFAIVTGIGTNQFFYDRNNRLTGAAFDRGLALAYVYDGNDNLVRQVSMRHDANTNGLPDLWEFLNGLTNNANAYTDTDGDGWSDWQEWKSGTQPTNSASTPNLLGNPGTNIASLTLPFTPSNFVVGVGQLDSAVAEEIVLGADGNPGTNINFLLVLTQGATTWQTQRVDVGTFGITSITVGQLTNRPSAGIYIGLRGTTNGSGRVMEFTRNGGVWQSNVIALSTNQAAFVLGVRGQDLLVSLATTNAPDGSLSSVIFGTNWNLSLVDTNTSHRGLGMLAMLNLQTQAPLRLLDAGGIQANISDQERMAFIPAGTFQMGNTFAEGNSSELPVHNVYLSAFYMDKYEVTKVLWEDVRAWGVANGYTDLPVGSGKAGNHPVHTINWFDAVKWCNARSEKEGLQPAYYTDATQNTVYRTGQISLTNACLKWNANGYRLPTEGEWEKAARGELIGRRFPWGDTISHSQANYHSRADTAYDISPTRGYHPTYSTGGTPYTSPVGSFAANGYGLHDMAGNIWEWVWDWYDSTYYSQPAATQENPHGPIAAANDHVVRGGSWADDPDSARCARRTPYAPLNSAINVGFRCVRETLFNTIAAEPESAASILNWRGSSLTSGSLRGTNGSSVLYSFAADKNANGLIDFADDFVIAEYLVSGTNASLLTLSRQPIVSLTPAQSYGLASVSFLNTSNEVFFTGEPDGQVFAWTATGATNPLQRQMFSGHHAGKAWHALACVKTFEPGEGLIGLRIDSTNQSRCDVILWSPQLQLPQLVSLPNTAPAAAVLPATNTLGSLALVTVRLWDAEGNASSPFLQYQFSGSTNWQNATLTTLNGGAYSISNRVAASPSGVNHIAVWNAQADVGANVVTNILLRARARDITLLGEWSLGTAFNLNTALADNDGMDDSWELLFFGNTSRTGSADFDGDGFTDFQEYIADTNPTNAASNLRFTSISRMSNTVKIDWLGGSNATQFVQRALSLSGGNAWSNLITNLPPTPITGSYTDTLGTNVMKFYRIEVTR